jgi:hypothetical protein
MAANLSRNREPAKAEARRRKRLQGCERAAKFGGMATSSFTIPPRVPPVEPELLASAIFVFGEYLRQVAADNPVDEDEDDQGQEIDTAAVLDLLADELGTNVTVTLTLYMRVTALYRLLAASPSLARLAVDQEDPDGALTEDALLAAARLELRVARSGEDGSADFDPREFREALHTA